MLAVLRSDQARVERLVQDAVGQLTAAASASSVQVSRIEKHADQRLVCSCLPEQDPCALGWPLGCMHDRCFSVKKAWGKLLLGSSAFGASLATLGCCL